MNVLLVFAHPDRRSLNGALRDVAVQELQAQGHEVRVSDLYAQGWKAQVDHADFPLLAPDARLVPTAASKQAFQAEALTRDVQAEIEKLRTQPIPGDELERVKSYLVGTFATGLQDQEDVALRMALAQLYGEGLESVFHRDARFRALTAAKIQAAAVEYLNPERAVKAVVRPIMH